MWLYGMQVVLGTGAEQFNDPTATLLLQIDCIERDSLELRCVGYAVIPLFVDPREEAQPRRKNLLDYILNQVGMLARLCFARSRCGKQKEKKRLCLWASILRRSQVLYWAAQMFHLCVMFVSVWLINLTVFCLLCSAYAC